MSGEDPGDDPPDGEGLDLEAYAVLQLRLAAEDREVVLREHGLTEASFDALDERVQAALSAALDDPSLDADGPGVTVPPIVARYDAALRKASEGLEPPLTLERFAEATVVLRAATDPMKALASKGITFGDYQRSTAVWAARLSKDDVLARRFADLLR